MKSIQTAFVCTLLIAILFLFLSMMYLTLNKGIFSGDKRMSGRDAIHMLMHASVLKNKINKMEGVRSNLELLLSPEVEQERNLSNDGETDKIPKTNTSTEKDNGNISLPLTGIDNKSHGVNLNPDNGKNSAQTRKDNKSPPVNLSLDPSKNIIKDGGNLSSLPVKVEDTCKEKTNILLLKTHKTGGSTLQNVLYRFGDVRDLTFALPLTDVYMGSPVKFKPSFAIRSPTGQYNILANHARFHKENMRKIMAPGAKFITILRYPPKQFESTYSYYKMERRMKCSLETFAASPKSFYNYEKERNSRHSSLNPMLYDLGLDILAMNDPVKVQNWIHYIDDAFDLVLIAEYLKESLILLKEMMCWSFDDIIYFTSNARSGMLIKQLSNATTNNLLNWLDGDVRLYRHFNTTLWNKIRQYGVDRMAADVAELDRRNEKLSQRCVKGKTKVSEMGGNTIIERYILRPEAARDITCKRITYSAYSYLTSLRHKMNMRRPKKIEGAN
ncbi:galactosylceramide sulfotransferase-like [Asterias amurensis]|uniref:galactosylceramide sulfotransferase-like n=1 Tax=Asterias amurensis TaxID=7602 RepID=UPI003AB7F5C9